VSEVVTLDTPDDLFALFLASGSEAAGFVMRPAFTGDIYKLTNERLVMLVQHPCAMRKGAELSARLLVCDVTVNNGGVPRDWSRGHFKRMFLPPIADESYAAELDSIDVIDRAELEAGNRVAILSAHGVNVLVQRWLHHNSRVVVPTITINSQTAGPFEEADLVGDACDELVGAGMALELALEEIDAWLSERFSDPGSSRREMLGDPQQRSSIRTALRQQTRTWKNELDAEAPAA
jgi:hypothetical protein